MNAVEARDLSKSYDGASFALGGVTFSIPQGEIFGFLGPNGSGKTTTVRLLNGILQPSGGSGTILGKDIKSHSTEIHSLCGVMTETASVYESLTGVENLNFFGRMFSMEEKDIRERGSRLLEQLGLYDAKDRKVKGYSTGMKKKLSLARALLHRPRILFLDEPTSGLDPEAAVNVTNMIRDLSREHGVTVFLCTHQLKYAEDICTLYGFIHSGSLLGFGTFRQLLEQKNSAVYLEIRGDGIPESMAGEQMGDGSIRIPISSDDEASRVIQGILSGGGRVYEARQVRWSLEDLYFSYVKEAMA